MVLTTSFYVYSSLLPLMPIGCLIYFILQIIIAKYSKQQFSDRSHLLILLAVYLSGALCGMVGYSMHIIPSDSIWCETVGMAFCFSLLGASKAFLLAYFLKRAKAIIIKEYASRLKIFIFNVVIPIYIMIYYLLYLIFTSILFKGGHYDVSIAGINQTQISFCGVAESSLTFLVIAANVDLMNAIIAVAAFVYPLYMLMKLAQIKDKELVNAMKWNVALSFMATMSSALNLFMVPYAGHLIWCFCLGDPFVNASCCFFMMATNRQFCCGNCICARIKKERHSFEKDVQNLQQIQLGTAPQVSASNDHEVSSKTEKTDKTVTVTVSSNEMVAEIR